MEVKTNHVHVITQIILNTFIEINFSVGCMVWPWCLFQDWLPLKILIRLYYIFRNKIFIVNEQYDKEEKKWDCLVAAWRLWWISDELEIKTFGLGSTIGDSFLRFAVVLCVTSGNVGLWDIAPQYLSYMRLYLKSDKIRNIVFWSMNNFETESDTKILALSVKCFNFNIDEICDSLNLSVTNQYWPSFLNQSDNISVNVLEKLDAEGS